MYYILYLQRVCDMQVTERLWYYISFVTWWLLVLYAAVELVLVYTYQFKVVRDGWEGLYNNSMLLSQNITADDL